MPDREDIEYADCTTPLGPVRIGASTQGIVSVLFYDELPEHARSDRPIILQCMQQLESYFDGRRTTFNVPLDLRGSGFQRKVWELLLQIPYGSTRSYSDIARKLGDMNAVRAVGAANGKNPVAVIVPCHRVIAANGNLTGYAAGIQRKEWLLKHEGAILSLL